MFDWPEVAWAHDLLWTAVAERLSDVGISAPPKIDRSRAVDDVWRDRGLVLSQTCGFPFATRLRGMVRLVAVPTYDAAGCQGAAYSSMVVVRQDEAAEEIGLFAGRRFAYNAADSLSGFLALKSAMREAGLDPSKVEWIETGSHRASIRAVAAEEADVAAVDAVCWALALKHEAEPASMLKVIAVTPLRPGLPLITAVERTDREVSAMRAAIRAAILDSATEAVRAALHITGVGTFDEWDYWPIAALARRLA